MLLFRLRPPSAKPEELENLVEFSAEGPGGGVEEGWSQCIAVESVPGGEVEKDGPACIVVELVPNWGNAHVHCSLRSESVV